MCRGATVPRGFRLPDPRAVAKSGAMEIRKTRRGARILHGPHVLSEVLAQPGPTHSVFDVLAAAAAAFSNGDELLALGFAGGGMVAALRALGRADRVQGVDLDLRGARIFERLGRGWSGEVHVARSDATSFLRRSRRRYACVVEDLSVQLADRDVQKPDDSYGPLPGLIAGHLSRGGVAVFNLLPTDARSWPFIMHAVASPFHASCVVHLDGFENRVLIAAAALPSARAVRARLDALLALIGSRMQGTLSARRLA